MCRITAGISHQAQKSLPRTRTACSSSYYPVQCVSHLLASLRTAAHSGLSVMLHGSLKSTDAANQQYTCITFIYKRNLLVAHVHTFFQFSNGRNSAVYPIIYNLLSLSSTTKIPKRVLSFTSTLINACDCKLHQEPLRHFFFQNTRSSLFSFTSVLFN